MTERFHFGEPVHVTQQEIESRLETPPVPVVVALADRAIALDAIMTYLNKANQVRGGQIQLQNGGGGLKRRYGARAKDVQAGAERNRNQLLSGFREGISVLAAEEALRRDGVDEADIELEVLSMQAAINRQFGVGRAVAKDRAAVVAAAKRAAGTEIK